MSPFLSEQKSKIFLAGDSWGCGEFNQVGQTGIGISHKGIEQYFIDVGYVVVNSSLSGMGNTSAVQRLAQDLYSSHCAGDIILWIQTEGIRDLAIRDSNDKEIYPVTEAIKSAGGIINLYKQLVDKNYQELDALAKRFDTVIYAIGGCGSLFTDTITKYTNLVPLIPSCVELISGQHPDFQFIGLWGIDDIDLATYNAKFADQIIEEFDSIVRLEEIFQEGGFVNRHPDRNGYKIVFEYIKHTLGL